MRSNGRTWSMIFLAATVLVPSAGVLTLARSAVINERLASQQRLRVACELQVDVGAGSIARSWSDLLHRIDTKTDTISDEAAFRNVAATLAEEGLFAAPLVIDTSGRVTFPVRGMIQEPTELSADELRARDQEFVDLRFELAIQTCRQIIAQASGVTPKTLRAKMAIARCLAKLGDRQAAVSEYYQVHADAMSVDREALAAAAATRAIELLVVSGLSTATPEFIAKVRHLDTLLDSESAIDFSHRTHLRRHLDDAIGRKTDAVTRIAASALRVADHWRESGTEPLAEYPDHQMHPSPSGRLQLWVPTESLQKWAEQQLSQESIGGVNLLPLPPGQAPDVDDKLLAVREIGKALPNWHMVAVDGQPRRFDQAGGLIRAASGVLGLTALSAVGLIVVVRRRLRSADSQNDLVSVVAHELKTPLASTRMLVDTLLADDASRDERTDDYLRIIGNENRRLSRLVDHFLTFSRLGARRFSAAKPQVSIRDIVAEASRGFRIHHASDAGRLSIGCIPDVTVRADIDLVAMALENLLSNAAKYSPHDDPIEVAAVIGASTVRMIVRDHGPGLSSGERRRVFRKYFRADARIARTDEGCGLGLSVVRRITEQHGGRTGVDRRAGGGSEFWIELPVAVPVEGQKRQADRSESRI